MKITIITYSDLNIIGGSTIRIIGYSYFLKDNDIFADFYNPFEIPIKLKDRINYKKFKIANSLKILLRYYCFAPKILFFLKYIIKTYPFIKDIEKTNNIIIFHQNFSLGLFLTLSTTKSCIYDIHGLREFQREYFENLSLRHKIRFYRKLLTEKNYFKFGKYFNATSKEMKNLLIKRHKIKPKNILVAHEGLLESFREVIKVNLLQKIKLKYNILKEEIIILFAGDFKIYGGIWDLVQAFYIIHKKNSLTKLFLIGWGQEEKKIIEFIKEKKLKGKIILLGMVDYKYLSTYQAVAKIIVCPDNNNYYNQITPHIKIFDSLASGKPVVLSNFKTFYDIIEEFHGIELFKPGNVEDLAKKIIMIINSYEKYSNAALYNKDKIKEYTYKKRTENYFKNLKILFNNS